MEFLRGNVDPLVLLLDEWSKIVGDEKLQVQPTWFASDSKNGHFGWIVGRREAELVSEGGNAVHGGK